MVDVRACSRHVSVSGVWGGRRCGRPAIPGSDLCKPHETGRRRSEDNRINRIQNWDAEKIEDARRKALLEAFITELDHYNAARIKAVYDRVREYLRVKLVNGMDEPKCR